MNIINYHGEGCECEECIHAPSEHVEVDKDMRSLISWRDSLALDDWGPGHSSSIKYKLCHEQSFIDRGKSRIPKGLEETYNRFMAMSEDDQYNVVYAVIGE